MENIQFGPPTENRAFFEDWESAVITFWRRSIEKNNVRMLSILPGGGGQLGKDGFVMLLARWRDSKNMKLH